MVALHGIPSVAKYVLRHPVRCKVMSTPFHPLKTFLPFPDPLGFPLPGVHHLGLIFRDLKPFNILLDFLGNAYLSDVGLVSQSTSRLTFISVEKHNQDLRAFATSTLKAEMMSGFLSSTTSGVNMSTVSLAGSSVNLGNSSMLQRQDSSGTGMVSAAPVGMAGSSSPRSPRSPMETDMHWSHTGKGPALATAHTAAPSPSSPREISSIKDKFELRTEATQVQRQEIVGTEGYRAPEMFYKAAAGMDGGAKYGFSVDWWAFGVLCFKLQRGLVPFHSDIQKPSQKEAQGEFDEVDVFSLDPAFTGKDRVCSTKANEDNLLLTELIKGLLTVDVEKRLGTRTAAGSTNLNFSQWDSEMGGMCTHPFYASIDWRELVAQNSGALVGTKGAPKEFKVPRLERTPPKFDSFDECIKEIGDEPLVGGDYEQEELDRFFSSWNYQNPCTKLDEVSAGEFCSVQDGASKQRESKMKEHSDEADRVRSAIYSVQLHSPQNSRGQGGSGVYKSASSPQQQHSRGRGGSGLYNSASKLGSGPIESVKEH